MTTPVNDVTAKQPAEQPPTDPKFDKAVENAQQQEPGGAQVAQIAITATLPLMLEQFQETFGDVMSQG
jgi:hypothetical protein